MDIQDKLAVVDSEISSMELEEKDLQSTFLAIEKNLYRLKIKLEALYSIKKTVEKEYADSEISVLKGGPISDG